MKSSRPVVLLCGPALHAVSGVTTHVALLLAAIPAMQATLVHFQVGSEGRDEGRLGRLGRLLASPLRLAWAIVAEGVDVVHLNTSLNARAFWRDLAYLLVARCCGRRVVYQVHGGALPWRFCRDNPLLAGALRATLRLPDVIVVLATCELDSYRAFVPGQAIVSLPNGIDCAVYGVPPDLASANAARRDDGAPLRIVYLGRLARDKGLFEALQGFWHARARGLKARFDIVGSGPDEGALKALATRLTLDRNVFFAGPLFGAAKVAALQGADVLLFPSYAEGLPYVLLEAMAAGVPPITTRVGAIPDVIEEGVHGVFVPPRDAHAIARALRGLAADRPRLGLMSAACRQRITSRYAIERTATEFARIYAALCPARQARPTLASGVEE